MSKFAQIMQRLDSNETSRADRKLWNKTDYKNCASRWSLTQYSFTNKFETAVNVP